MKQKKFYTVKEWKKLYKIQDVLCKKFDVILTDHKTKQEKIISVFEKINLKNFNKGMISFNKIIQDFGSSMEQLTSEINTSPKNDVKISNHFFKFTFSFKKKELNKIANGIANCDPIIIGDIIFASFNDKVIKKFVIKPIHIEKKNKGNQYFFSGILNFQKGIRQINTISILKLPSTLVELFH